MNQETGLPPPAPRNHRPMQAIIFISVIVVLVVLVAILIAQHVGGTQTAPSGVGVSVGVGPPPDAAPEVHQETHGPADTENLARVTITTTPPDVTLTVDRRVIAGQSPFVLTNIDTKWPLRVRVERVGYQPNSQEVTVREPEARVEITLVPVPPPQPPPAPPRRGRRP